MKNELQWTEKGGVHKASGHGIYYVIHQDKGRWRLAIRHFLLERRYIMSLRDSKAIAQSHCDTICKAVEDGVKKYIDSNGCHQTYIDNLCKAAGVNETQLPAWIAARSKS